MTQVYHDATLTGGGTSASDLLSVVSGGVGGGGYDPDMKTIRLNSDNKLYTPWCYELYIKQNTAYRHK